ncbi:MAG: hypothetical protein KatS3mg111_2244 [Pirellulaceae bacterium]|nr:MAG: hypothetical protein KatS3mg111_2244 [Pirellulaceae bacterium]
MLEEAHLRSCDRIIDVGCGTGTLLSWAVSRSPGIKATGVDADRQALHRARRKMPPPNVVNLVVASCYRLPFADDSFDVAFCSLLLHHLDDVEKEATLAEIHRVLAPQGRLLLADYLGIDSSLAKLRFLVVRCLDGWRRTRFALYGHPAVLLRRAGFVDIRETRSWSTPLGPLRCYRATNTRLRRQSCDRAVDDRQHGGGTPCRPYRFLLPAETAQHPGPWRRFTDQ